MIFERTSPKTDFDLMPFGIFRATPAGKIVFVNTAIVQMLGYDSKAGLLAVNVKDLSAKGEDHSNFMALLKKNGSVLSFDTCLFKKDKTVVWVSLSANALSDEKGNVIYWEGILEDITRRKQIENELLQEKLFSETVINSLPAIFYMLDERGRIVRINRQHLRATGYSEEETLHMDALDFFPPRFHTYIKARVAEMFSLGKTIAEANLLTKDGREIPYYFSASGVQIDGRRYGVGVGVDMTEKFQHEELLRQAHKMEAIGALASGIAHDFNNILGSILGFTQLAIDGLPQGGKERHRLGKVIESAQRAKSLVSRILMYSRPSETKKEAVQLSPIVKEAIGFLRATLPATIEIRADFPAKSDWIMADPTQMHQIVMNLCTNAGQAMQDRAGILEILLADTELKSQTSISRISLPPGPYVVLTVRDSGCGIPQAHMDRIFDPYFTTKTKGHGTGLGLTIVFGIVKDMGGAVQVNSQEGAGTTFELFFPVLMQNESVGSKAVTAAPAAATGRIMIVDDEADLLEVYGELLENMGYSVILYHESPAALEDFAAQPDQYDLVLTDFTMPAMTGIQLAEAMHRIRPGLPVLMYSGSVADIPVGAIKRAGIAAVVAKPLEKNELAQILAQHLKK